MRAYFTTSIRNISTVTEAVEMIYKEVRKNGIEIDEFNSPKNVDPRFKNIDAQTDTEIIDAYKHISDSIKKSAFVIAELTNTSSAVGFEVAISINEKKPVLVLYNATRVKKLSTPFRGNTSSYLKVTKYNSIDEIPQIINSFIFNLDDFLDRKFNFKISSEMYKFLSNEAMIQGITKSDIVRSAINALILSKSKDISNID